MKTVAEMGICKHCNMEIAIRNPSGFCDHLYYPSMCAICNEPNKKKEDFYNATPIFFNLLQETFVQIEHFDDCEADDGERWESPELSALKARIKSVLEKYKGEA